nr:reverse transcriptase domain-containing protein [Tanacetum cinerariifolium]
MNLNSVDKNDPKELQDENIMYDIASSVEINLVLIQTAPKDTMPSNVKIYYGSTDLNDRFIWAGNHEEWPMPVWCRAIGGTLSAKGRTELCSILMENLDIFAWQPSDMTGVPRSVAEHQLNIREGYSPVLVEILKEKSIKEKEVTTVVEEDGPTWMTPIMEYLKEGTLPSDRKEARKLRFKARQYELLEGVFTGRTPWLRCVGPLQAEYVIREIHEGSCSMHAGPQSFVSFLNLYHEGYVVLVNLFLITTDRGTPVMSDGCNANISKFSIRIEHSSVRPFADNVPPIA